MVARWQNELSRDRALELRFGLLVLEMGRPRFREKIAANSAQAFEEVISIRTASIRGFGGSTPNRVGGSPFSTAHTFRPPLLPRTTTAT